MAELKYHLRDRKEKATRMRNISPITGQQTLLSGQIKPDTYLSLYGLGTKNGFHTLNFKKKKMRRKRIFHDT